MNEIYDDSHKNVSFNERQEKINELILEIKTYFHDNIIADKPPRLHEKYGVSIEFRETDLDISELYKKTLMLESLIA